MQLQLLTPAAQGLQPHPSGSSGWRGAARPRFPGGERRVPCSVTQCHLVSCCSCPAAAPARNCGPRSPAGIGLHPRIAGAIALHKSSPGAGGARGLSGFGSSQSGSCGGAVPRFPCLRASGCPFPRRGAQGISADAAVAAPPRAQSLLQSCFEMGHPKSTPTSDSSILQALKPPSLTVTGSSID